MIQQLDVLYYPRGPGNDTAETISRPTIDAHLRSMEPDPYSSSSPAASGMASIHNAFSPMSWQKSDRRQRSKSNNCSQTFGPLKTRLSRGTKTRVDITSSPCLRASRTRIIALANGCQCFTVGHLLAFADEH